MPLGYCRVCDRLVALVRRPSVTPPAEMSRRRCDWVPVEHEDERTGVRCPGHRMPI